MDIPNGEDLKWGIVSMPCNFKWDKDITQIDLSKVEKHGMYLKNTIYLKDIDFPYEKLIDIAVPIAKKWFNVDITKLKILHSTLVNFTMDGDREIKEHVDNRSIITINYCLFSDAVGSDIVFVNSKKINAPFTKIIGTYTVKLKTGWMYIHKGSHPHSTNLLQSGRRYSAILWFGY